MRAQSEKVFRASQTKSRVPRAVQTSPGMRCAAYRSGVQTIFFSMTCLRQIVLF